MAEAQRRRLEGLWLCSLLASPQLIHLINNIIPHFKECFKKELLADASAQSPRFIYSQLSFFAKNYV